MKQMLAKKVGMTQVFDPEGNIVPVTVLQAGPLTVIQKKTKEKDGYEAVQIGFLPAKEKRVNKPLAGHFKKHGVKPFRVVREIRFDGMNEAQAGQELKVEEFFKPGEFVDVISISKGKGFQGVMKRHNFGGGPASHGGMSHRRPAAAGETESEKVYRGKRSPGHMGDDRVTVVGLEVVSVEPEKQLLLVKGGVPGAGGCTVFLRTSNKSAYKMKKLQTRASAKAAELQAAGGKEKKAKK